MQIASIIVEPRLIACSVFPLCFKNSTTSSRATIASFDDLVQHPNEHYHSISQSLSSFSSCPESFVSSSRNAVTRGAGYGLEIPCVYTLYRPKPYIDKLKELVASLKAKGWSSHSLRVINYLYVNCFVQRVSLRATFIIIYTCSSIFHAVPILNSCMKDSCIIYNYRYIMLPELTLYSCL